jgi:hypothetical protein
VQQLVDFGFELVLGHGRCTIIIDLIVTVLFTVLSRLLIKTRSTSKTRSTGKTRSTTITLFHIYKYYLQIDSGQTIDIFFSSISAL